MKPSTDGTGFYSSVSMVPKCTGGLHHAFSIDWKDACTLRPGYIKKFGNKEFVQ